MNEVSDLHAMSCSIPSLSATLSFKIDPDVLVLDTSGLHRQGGLNNPHIISIKRLGIATKGRQLPFNSRLELCGRASPHQFLERQRIFGNSSPFRHRIGCYFDVALQPIGVPAVAKCLDRAGVGRSENLCIARQEGDFRRVPLQDAQWIGNSLKKRGYDSRRSIFVLSRRACISSQSG